MSTSKKLLFALDYDGTYTEDPELWRLFIKLLKARGHDVLVATMRTQAEGDDMCPKLRELVPWIVFTHRRAKREYLSMFGITPNIWIDDRPDFLFSHGADPLPADPGIDLLLSTFGGS